MKRLFFALWPDRGVRAQLAERAGLLQIDTGRLIPWENYHVTLVFLGNVQEQDIPGLLDSAGRLRISRFPLLIDRCGWWKRAQVAWLAPQTAPAPLLELVEQLNRLSISAGVSVDKRDYSPHLTVARKLSRPVTASTFDPVHWDVGEFCLVESVTHARGARYRVMKSWALF